MSVHYHHLIQNLATLPFSFRVRSRIRAAPRPTIFPVPLPNHMGLLAFLLTRVLVPWRGALLSQISAGSPPSDHPPACHLLGGCPWPLFLSSLPAFFFSVAVRLVICPCGCLLMASLFACDPGSMRPTSSLVTFHAPASEVGPGPDRGRETVCGGMRGTRRHAPH